MSKWRPTLSGCLYVIPDIHGSYSMLNKILARILPLRKINGVQDQIIFLGDYIDRHQDSCKVLDKIIQIKEKDPDNIFCLLGNHELTLLETLNMAQTFHSNYSRAVSYQNWILNGGYQTLRGYVENKGLDSDPFKIPIDRIHDYIPNKHIEFLTNLLPYYETTDYIFVHASNKDLNDIKTVTWDRTLYKEQLKNVISSSEEEKIVVCGHCHRGPVIRNKYLMLDCGAPNKMLAVELNSMDAFMFYPNKNRAIAVDLLESFK